MRTKEEIKDAAFMAFTVLAYVALMVIVSLVLVATLKACGMRDVPHAEETPSTQPVTIVCSCTVPGTAAPKETVYIIEREEREDYEDYREDYPQYPIDVVRKMRKDQP